MAGRCEIKELIELKHYAENYCCQQENLHCQHEVWLRIFLEGEGRVPYIVGLLYLCGV